MIITTEVLKQPQYNPLSVAEQVSILFAANSGYLDDVRNADIKRFKSDWFSYFAANLPDMAERFNQGSALSDEDKEALNKALTEFKKTF